ncbi:hypothetical protein JNUCC0626_48140 [Lentzea sp. JNUCC 0626]|uniref:WXG100-like domain-containing protein n=1 Tax=Lentzea sp. JNUCC 0626 TaxID=3367513 RepID=UPI003748149D
MVTHLPHGLQKLLEITVGMPWPEGNQKDLRDLAWEWEVLSGELDLLADGLLATADNLVPAFRGDTGAKINELLSIQLRDNAVQLKENAGVHASMLRTAAADIEKTKIMIVGMLAVLAATIASLLASLFGAFAVPAVIAAARVGIGAVLRTLLARLVQTGIVTIVRQVAIRGLVGGLVGAGLMVGLDAGIQGWQIAHGDRDGWDTESLKGSAIGGAIGGAFSGAAEGLHGFLGKLGRDLWRTLPRAVRGFAPLGSTLLQIPVAALSNPVIGAATKSPGSASEGVLGALEPSGGKRPAAKRPHVDMPNLKPIGDLGLLPSIGVPEFVQKGLAMPVTDGSSAPVGVAFDRPAVPLGASPEHEIGTRQAVRTEASGPPLPRTEEGPAEQASPVLSEPAEDRQRRPVETREGGVGEHAALTSSRVEAVAGHDEPDTTGSRTASPGTRRAEGDDAVSGERARVPAQAGGSGGEGDRPTGPGTPGAPPDVVEGGHIGQPVEGGGVGRGVDAVTGGVLTASAGRAAGGVPGVDRTAVGSADGARPGAAEIPGAITGSAGPGDVRPNLSGSVVSRLADGARPDVVMGTSTATPAASLAARGATPGRSAPQGASARPDTSAMPAVVPPVASAVIGDVRPGGAVVPAVTALAPNLSTDGPKPPAAGGVHSHGQSGTAPSTTGGVTAMEVEPAFRTTFRQGDVPAPAERGVMPQTSSPPVADQVAGSMARAGSPDGPHENRPRTVSAPVTGEPVSAGGAARDFPRALADRFAAESTEGGRRGTVDDHVSLSEFLAGPAQTGEAARAGSASSAVVPGLGASPAWAAVEGIGVTGRNAVDGTAIAFTSADVQTVPMTQRGQVVGRTFAAGAGRAFDVARGQADKTGGTTHSLPQGAVTASLVGGTPVRGDGATFARPVNDTRAFRAAPELGGPDATALAVRYAGNLVRPGGVGHDFYQVLESEFGHAQPVFAGTTLTEQPPLPAERLVGTLSHQHGEWRRYPSGAGAVAQAALPGTESGAAPLRTVAVVGDLSLTGRDMRTHELREFRSSEVEATTLRRGEQVVGISLRQRENLVADQNWARAEQAATRPWPDNTMFVVAAGTNSTAIITVRGDQKFAVDGANLGRLLHDLSDFRSSVREQRPEMFALLASHSSEMRYPGGLARDFQATLAGDFGYSQPVVAPSGRPDLVVLQDSTAWAVLPDGRQWHTFHLKPVVDDVVLPGLDARTGEALVFRSSEVEVARLDRNGHVLGATFWPGERRDADLAWAAVEQSDHQLRQETGGAVVSEERLWPDSTFLVSAPSAPSPGNALVSVKDRIVVVNGADLARLVHDTRFFRSAVRAGDADVLALLISRSSAKNGPGGLAHDFQAVLADELGYPQPVLGQPRRVDKVVLDDGMAAVSVTGAWHTHHLPTVVGDVMLWGTDGETGAMVSFRSSEVDVAPMEHAGKVVGATFNIGPDLHFDQRWTRAEQDTRTYLFHGEASLTSLAVLDDDSLRVAVPRPWPAETFYVTTHGLPDGVAVNLADGTEVVVGGAVFARLLADVRFFHTAMRAAEPSAITMIVCHAGAIEGRGGVARDFQATLARNFEYRQPVYAATESVVGTLTAGDETAATAVENGGRWRSFPPPWEALYLDHGWRRSAAPSASTPTEIGRYLAGTAARGAGDELTLTGVLADGAGSRTFRVSEVEVALLERQGRVIGASFTSGADLRVDRQWAAAHQSGEAHHLTGEYDRALLDDTTATTRRPTPWPDNAFYLAAHGDGRSADILLTDGTRLKVDGTTFAGVLSELSFVTTSLRTTKPDALVMLVCQAATPVGPGGVAHDFQRALSELVGYSRPVYSPSRDLWLAFQRGEAVTAVVDGGGWWRHSAGSGEPASVGGFDGPPPASIDRPAARQAYESLARKAGLGASPSTSRSAGDLTLSGQVRPGGGLRPFRASDVSVGPLERDGRGVGMTFLTEADGESASSWVQADGSAHREWSTEPVAGDAVVTGPARDAFLIAARGDEHEVVVRLLDGTEVALNGRTFGQLLVGLRPFQAGVGIVRPAELGLLVSRSALLSGPGGVARDLQAHLAEVFGHRQRVLAPVGTKPGDGGWRTFSRPAVLGDAVLSGMRHRTDDVVVLRSSQVDVAPLVRDGSVVGATFWTGSERDHAQSWTSKAETPEHYLLADDLNVEPVPIEVSWPRSTFVVSGPFGAGETIVVRLVDGTSVRLEGQAVVRLLTDLRFFRAVLDADRPEQFALLVSQSGNRPGLGGLAADLQDTLSGDYGIRQPVIAPTGRMDTFVFVADRAAATAVEDGGGWRMFEVQTVSGDLVLHAQNPGLSSEVHFRSSEVVVGPLDRGGQIVGVTFKTGYERWYELTSARATNEGDASGPWQRGSHLVSVAGTTQHAHLSLIDGTTVAVDGRTLAVVLEDLRFFRDAMERSTPWGFVLLASRSGADLGRGGLAQDFQAALSGEFGRRQPVIAPVHPLSRFAFDQLAGKEVAWRSFTRPTVAENVELYGVDSRGELRPFRSSEVEISALYHRGSVIGASFTTGSDLVFDWWWGRNDKAAVTYLAQDRGDAGPSVPDDPNARTEIPTPWPDRTFYLAAHGEEKLIEINLVSGPRLAVTGADFARLLGDVRFFHAAMARERRDALTLLMCRVGAIDGPGGAAHDLQAVLAERFGYGQPVFAGSHKVRLLGTVPAASAVMGGGVWRRFPAENAVPSAGDRVAGTTPLGTRSGGSGQAGRPGEATAAARVVENLPLTGVSRNPVAFRTSDVRVELFEKDGRAVGVSFTTGTDLKTDVTVLTGKPSRFTNLMPAGVHKDAQYERAVREGRHEAVRVPWPDNSFFVSAHGKPGHFEVNLTDGTTIRLGGTAFARLVHDLRVFRGAIDQTGPDAVVLLVCHAGQVADRGGAAYEFQRALGEFGYRQPVISPTDVLFLRGYASGQWGTGVANGGGWRVFSSGPADLVGYDRAAGENVAFRPEGVQATALVRNGLVAGAAFPVGQHPPVDQGVGRGTESGLVDGASTSRGRQFVVRAAALAEGRFAVRLTGGRDVELEAPAFARVLARSSVFPAATGRPDSVLLLTSGVVEDRGRLAGGTPEFARALRQEVGEDLAVFTADDGAAALHREASALVAPGGWRRLPGSAPRSPFGLDHSGALRRFEPSDVRFTVLSDRSRQIGLAFGPSGDQARAERWARRSWLHRDSTYVDPDGEGRSRSDEASRVKAPWHDNALFIAAPGGADSFAIKLTDGTDVLVDGRNLAEVVAGLDVFRQAATHAPAGEVVLLTDRAGEVPGRGGAGHDFARALAELGLRRHVMAPTTGVRLRVPVFGQSADTVLDAGGTWRVLPVPESVSGQELSGVAGRFGDPVRFSTSEVMVRRMESSDGVLRGVTFTSGDDLRTDLKAALVLPRSRTPTSPADGDRGVRDPWPDNAFFVKAHGNHAAVEIELADGREVAVDGATLARLLHDLRPFREALAERAPEAVVLMACSTGERSASDGVAASFRSALGRLGHAHQVFAPTWTVVTQTGFGRTVTYVEDGEWRKF